MSKISKNIKMLDILSSGRKYSCKELAEELEVTPRMIRQYKEELEKEGIYIETIFGPNGGYKLISKIDTPLILFNEKDVELINKVINKISDTSQINQLNNLKEKIVNYCNLVNNEFLDENSFKKLNIIRDAIKNKKNVNISYYSKGSLKNRIIIPKQIYIMNNTIMIVAQYSDDKADIRHLKLDRIEKIL